MRTPAGSYPPIAKALTAGNQRLDSETETFLPLQGGAFNVATVGTDCFNGDITGDVAATLGARGSSQNASGPTVMQPVAHSLRADGFDASERRHFQDSEYGCAEYDTAAIRAGRIPEHSMVLERRDASEDGTGRGTPLVPAIAFGGQMSTPQVDIELSQTPGAKNPQAVALGFVPKAPAGSRSMGEAIEQAPTVTTHMNGQGVQRGMAVRRLTPVECERLQGFPDSYTDIPWRKKAHAPDGPRYKALGNSMANNVMGWIGQRIALVEAIVREHAQRAA